MSDTLDLEALDASLEKITYPELKALGTLHESDWWPALKKMLLRAQAQAVGTLSDFTADARQIAFAQGKVAIARELLQTLGTDAPAAYERERLKHEAPEDPDTDA